MLCIKKWLSVEQCGKKEEQLNETNVFLTRNSYPSLFGDKHRAIISYFNCKSLPENQTDIKAGGKLDSIQTTFELTLYFNAHKPIQKFPVLANLLT